MLKNTKQITKKLPKVELTTKAKSHHRGVICEYLYEKKPNGSREITFWRAPQRAKRERFIHLIFDEYGKIKMVEACGYYFTVGEVREYTNEVIADLINNGYLQYYSE